MIRSLEAQIFINCKGFITLCSFRFVLRQRSLLGYFVLDSIPVTKEIFTFLSALLLSLCSRMTCVLLLFQFACCCRDLQIHQFQIVVAFDILFDAFHIQLIILLELGLVLYIFICLLKVQFYFDLMLSVWVIISLLNF